MKNKWRAFILGIIFTVLVGAVGAIACIKLGMMPVATAAPPLPMEKTLARMALGARVQKEAPKSAPANVPADEPNVTAGALVYVGNCAVCHGQPSKPATAIAKGMFPVPPQLFKHGVTDDPVGETYWKVANGIRLTGMPGFTGSLSDTQLWQVSQMLATADKLPDTAKAELAKPIMIGAQMSGAPGASAGTGRPEPEHDHSDHHH